MKSIFGLLIITLTACGKADLNESKPKLTNSASAESQEKINLVEPNLDAEAKLMPIIDAAKGDDFNTAKNCNSKSTIWFDDGIFRVGQMHCNFEGIKVYIGSAELEYRVSACKLDGEEQTNSFFAFGSSSEGKYYIVSNDEVKKPVFICK